MSKLLARIISFFKRKPVATKPTTKPTTTPIPTSITPAPTSEPTPTKTPTFVASFAAIDLAKWIVSTWQAPCNSATNKGKFAAEHVSVVNGMLCLKLSQTKDANGVFQSVGGEISTVQKFGYGTYEFEAKASSNSINPLVSGQPVSGSITGLFSYAKDSITEIDVEVEGNTRSPIAQFTSWVLASNPNEHTTFTTAVAPHAVFHKYKYIWTPTDIKFYVDDVHVSTHTKVIPTTEAPFIINHYGTNNTNWGGLGTPDIDRFMFVKSFSFTPL